jgi:hypothetical protein
MATVIKPEDYLKEMQKTQATYNGGAVTRIAKPTNYEEFIAQNGGADFDYSALSDNDKIRADEYKAAADAEKYLQDLANIQLQTNQVNKENDMKNLYAQTQFATKNLNTQMKDSGLAGTGASLAYNNDITNRYLNNVGAVNQYRRAADFNIVNAYQQDTLSNDKILQDGIKESQRYLEQTNYQKARDTLTDQRYTMDKFMGLIDNDTDITADDLANWSNLYADSGLTAEQQAQLSSYGQTRSSEQEQTKKAAQQDAYDYMVNAQLNDGNISLAQKQRILEANKDNLSPETYKVYEDGLKTIKDTEINTAIDNFTFANNYKRGDINKDTYNAMTDNLGENFGNLATQFEQSGDAEIGKILRTLSTDMWSIADDAKFSAASGGILNAMKAREENKAKINTATDEVAKKVDAAVLALRGANAPESLITKLQEVSRYYWDVGDY